MFDVEEIMEHYERFIKKTNPREAVDEFNSALEKITPFGKIPLEVRTTLTGKWGTWNLRSVTLIRYARG